MGESKIVRPRGWAPTPLPPQMKSLYMKVFFCLSKEKHFKQKKQGRWEMWKTRILPGNTYVCLGKPRQGLENVRVCLGKTSKIMDQILGINLSEITAPVFYCLSKKTPSYAHSDVQQ